MPLRDHFRPPLAQTVSWEAFHAVWPTFVMMRLNQWLPRGYAVEPGVHFGSPEIDIASFEADEVPPSGFIGNGTVDQEGGGKAVVTETWAPPVAELSVAAEVPNPNEYEVRVYDHRFRRRLVAAVEIASPANLDRPSTRGMFVSKCVSLLRHGVAVTVVDLVTSSRFNLYAELLDLLGVADPSLPDPPPATYAASCRYRLADKRPVFEAWAYPMAVGAALPTLPLWLNARFAGPLDLEGSYEDACRALRIA
jgi:hypothetical protein